MPGGAPIVPVEDWEAVNEGVVEAGTVGVTDVLGAGGNAGIARAPVVFVPVGVRADKAACGTFAVCAGL